MKLKIKNIKIMQLKKIKSQSCAIFFLNNNNNNNNNNKT